MARVFGIEVGDTRVIPRLVVATTRTATLNVAAVSALAWAFDMTAFTDPADVLRMIIDVSSDDGVTWREHSVSVLPGGAVSTKSGESPRGLLQIPPGVTRVRATLAPVAGIPTVGLWAAAV